MRVLHCSDVHITGDYAAHSLWSLGWRRWIALAELRFGGRSRAFARARKSLAAIAAAAEQHRVDHLIVSGDLTAYALEEEFRGAREALGAAAMDPARCSVIPGNHDRYTPGSRRQRRFEQTFGHLLHSDWPEHRREDDYPFVRLLGAEAAIVGLNSARAPTMPGLSFGKIGTAQLEGLRAILADPRLGTRAVLVMVHHAPRKEDGAPDRRLHGLWDADALLGMLPGPRHAVLHGHIHRRYHHPATASSPHLFGAGSSTQAGREGYWLIDIAGGQVTGGTMHALGGD